MPASEEALSVRRPRSRPKSPSAPAGELRTALAVVAAVAAERQRLAKLLHDGACQTFSGVALFLRVLEKKLGEDVGAAGADWSDFKATLRQGLQEIHDLAAHLHGRSEEQGTLAASLQALAERCPEQLTFHPAPGDPPPEPSPEVTLPLVSLVREGLHLFSFGPDRPSAELTLRSGPDSTLELSLAGFCPGETPAELQQTPVWSLLRCHALLLRATLTLDPDEQGRCVLTCRLPSLP